MKPTVSVIMSVYNGETYLEEAVRSVMSQTYDAWELIAINDCSTDSTAEILSRLAEEDPRVKVYPNEVNLRLPKSLNRAVSLASGKYVARMDADDIALPDRLEKQVAFMESHPELSLSSCRFMTMKNGVFQSGGAGARADAAAIRALLLVSNPILHPGVIAKTEVFRSFPYDPTHTCTEDLELWSRLAMAGHQMAVLPECLLLYRLHDKQITATTMDRQYTEVQRVAQTYYRNAGAVFEEEMLKFFIRGVYFTHSPDTDAYLRYAKWLRKTISPAFGRDAVNYALFEVFAEYKRSGISKSDVLRILATFPPVFLAREILRRKQTAKHDIAKCNRVAKEFGLVQTAGTSEYPIFEKKAVEG